MIRAATALFLALTTSAQAAAPLCPPVLAVSQTPAAPPGFSSYQDGNPPQPGAATARFSLQNIMISEGPPEQSGTLVPDQDDPDRQVWNIKTDGDQNPWISCVYAGTTLFLAKPLPKDVAACTWRGGKNQAPAISCQ
jgi:hypothetical protein